MWQHYGAGNDDSGVCLAIDHGIIKLKNRLNQLEAELQRRKRVKIRF
jgi:hypothetical protein